MAARIQLLEREPQLIEVLQQLQSDPSPERLHNVSTNKYFRQLYKKAMHAEDGSESQMTMAYLKDVSALLALVSAVRESDLERHLEAEREMLKHCFAFDHINYARYLSFQHVFLRDLQRRNHPAIDDLASRGFGGSLSGNAFSSIHGDLITEVFNGETKRSAGPYKAGYSTDVEKVNTWIKTSHIHAKIQNALREKINMTTSSLHKELTPAAKRLHRGHVKSLKEKLQGYQIDPFADVPARHITTGNEINARIIKGLLAAPELGNKKYKSFVEERLVKGTVDFYKPIRKNFLETGLKKKSKVPRAITVLKQDRQSFGTLLSESLSLSEAFKYPLTPLPLSIATPEGNIRQAPKHLFRNFLIEESKALTNIIPTNARWLIDGMAVMRTVKPKQTYGEWMTQLLKFVQPPKETNPLSIELVNDTYLATSIKSSTREKRGEQQQRTYLQGFEQKMPQGNGWSLFFNNIENKTDLISLVAKYMKRYETRKNFLVPMIFTERKETWEATKDSLKMLFYCNHEEADTRLVLHACLQDTNVFVVSKDTDVLILLVHAYGLVKPKHIWHMKIDHDKFVDVNKVYTFLGERVSTYLPQLHAITGCDTTSFFYGVGKVKVLKKLNKDDKSLLFLNEIGKAEHLSQKGIADAIRFVQTILYNGKIDESLVQTRIRLYKGLKTKSSEALPPDPDSLTQAIIRVHLQSYYWLQCQELQMRDIDMENNGWYVDAEGRVLPVWFTGIRLFLYIAHTKSFNF